MSPRAPTREDLRRMGRSDVREQAGKIQRLLADADHAKREPNWPEIYAAAKVLEFAAAFALDGDLEGAPPGYWQNEQTGVLQPVVHRYLNGGVLSSEEVATMRAYLRQWVCASGWSPATPWLADLRSTVDEIRTYGELRDWMSRARDAGLDPL